MFVRLYEDCWADPREVLMVAHDSVEKRTRIKFRNGQQWPTDVSVGTIVTAITEALKQPSAGPYR